MFRRGISEITRGRIDWVQTSHNVKKVREENRRLSPEARSAKGDGGKRSVSKESVIRPIRGIG
jgi:hypothetical protein